MLLVTVMALGVPGSWLFGPMESPATPAALPETAPWLREPSRPPNPLSAPAAQVADWFARMPAPVTADLAARYPRLVGALDGAPVTLRYAANARLDRAAGGRQLLLYDPRGDGRIAEVVGDLGAADRVVVLVPGVDSRLANFDRGHGGHERRAPSWQARQLAAAIRAADPTVPVAVIAWLGYDPPEGVRRDALREERAAAGAVALEHLVAGLTARRPHRSVEIVGHSYGSSVAALAAPALGPQVTDIVALGSPGMGGADQVADLHSRARIWAGSAPHDWTRKLPGLQILGVGHGRLPIDPGFGALSLPAADVQDHDGYFMPGSSALRAMAQIAVGHVADVGTTAR